MVEFLIDAEKLYYETDSAKFMVESTVVPLTHVQFSAEESQRVWGAIYNLVKNGPQGDTTGIRRKEKRGIRGGKTQGHGCHEGLFSFSEGFLMLRFPQGGLGFPIQGCIQRCKDVGKVGDETMITVGHAPRILVVTWLS